MSLLDLGVHASPGDRPDCGRSFPPLPSITATKRRASVTSSAALDVKGGIEPVDEPRSIGVLRYQRVEARMTGRAGDPTSIRDKSTKRGSVPSSWAPLSAPARRGAA